MLFESALDNRLRIGPMMPMDTLGPSKNKVLYARAVYDNVPDAPDELPFMKGEVLVVLDQWPRELPGWWLCSLGGRKGICPANRLQIWEAQPCRSMWVTQPMPPTGRRCHQDLLANNKVVVPQRIGQIYVYDMPVALSNDQQQYDVPVPSNKAITGSPFATLARNGVCNGLETYDVPLPSAHQKMPSHQRTPSLVSDLYDIPRAYLPDSTPTPLDDYDIPKSAVRPIHSPSPLRENGNVVDCPEYSNLPLMDSDTYDIPQAHGKLVFGKIGTCPEEVYDIPPPARFRDDLSGRSSNASVLSSVSQAPSECSLTNSLSLSSLGGMVTTSGSGSEVNSNRSSGIDAGDSLEIPTYDIPPTSHKLRPTVLSDITPTSSIPTSVSSGQLSSASSTQLYDPLPSAVPLEPSSTTNIVYDIPPQVTRDVTTLPSLASDCYKDDITLKKLSNSSVDSGISLLPSQELLGFLDDGVRELPLELDAALEMLVKLQQDVYSATSRLFSFVSASWRNRNSLEISLSSIRLVCCNLRTSLQDFVDFSMGALGNAAKSAHQDLMVSERLSKLLRPLRDANALVQRAYLSLEQKHWNLNNQVCEAASQTDELDEIVASARSLVDDVRQVSSFIQGNATLIFHRSPAVPSTISRKCHIRDRPLPNIPANGKHTTGKKEKKAVDENLYENDGHTWVEDYDYVKLESLKAQREEEAKSLPTPCSESGSHDSDTPIKDSLVTETDSSTQDVTKAASKLDYKDKLVVDFFASQLIKYQTFLTNAIDTFLHTIESNQPPRIFVAHSKYVVIAAHKLVYIGDSITRAISHPEGKPRMQLRANALCDTLQSCVKYTKLAAEKFPSVMAVQDMVDSMVDLSHAANDMRAAVKQAALM